MWGERLGLMERGDESIGKRGSEFSEWCGKMSILRAELLFCCMNIPDIEEARFGLIGFPARGSLSPRLFEAAYHGRWPYDLLDEADFAKAYEAFLQGAYLAVNVTAPHKMAASAAMTRQGSDLTGAESFQSPEVIATGAANILLKTSEGVKAYNSDVLAVESLLEPFVRSIAIGRGDTFSREDPGGPSDPVSSIVLGGGGAGKAALYALEQLGLRPSLVHHGELGAIPVVADIVVCTLPKAVPGLEKIRCECLLEANYRTPSCKGLPGVKRYIGGVEWLKAQAVLGYALMTGTEPDVSSIEALEVAES